MTGLYLAAIVASMLGVGLIDRRHKLALFGGFARRTAGLVAAGVTFFVLWDILGIQFGAFFRGESSAYIGVELLPELPLEEVFFLTFLSYLSLVAWRAAVQLRARFARPVTRNSGEAAELG